jgi:hypothetical protein
LVRAAGLIEAVLAGARLARAVDYGASGLVAGRLASARETFGHCSGCAKRDELGRVAEEEVLKDRNAIGDVHIASALTSPFSAVHWAGLPPPSPPASAVLEIPSGNRPRIMPTPRTDATRETNLPMTPAPFLTRNEDWRSEVESTADAWVPAAMRVVHANMAAKRMKPRGQPSRGQFLSLPTFRGDFVA